MTETLIGFCVILGVTLYWLGYCRGRWVESDTWYEWLRNRGINDGPR